MLVNSAGRHRQAGELPNGMWFWTLQRQASADAPIPARGPPYRHVTRVHAAAVMHAPALSMLPFRWTHFKFSCIVNSILSLTAASTDQFHEASPAAARFLSRVLQAH